MGCAKMKKCRYCGSEKIWKNGKRNKKQNYMCKDCRCQFTSEHGGRHTEQEEKLAVLLYCMGLSMTSIGKILHSYIDNHALDKEIRTQRAENLNQKVKS